MALEEFASLVSGICAHTSLVRGRPIFWTIIANPQAGGFTIRSRWKKHHALLVETVQRAVKNPLNKKAGPSQIALGEGGPAAGTGLVLTRGGGHAKEITGALIEEAAKTANQGRERPFYIIITAGGDGTSLEVMTCLYHAPAAVRKNFAVLRLPMGTGNDGSDAWELDKALNLLIEPAKLSTQRAVALSTSSGKGPFLAFNILSVGMDAFVTHMTNRMKGKLPGDSYKLWVDIAAFFYDFLYKVDFMEVRALDEAGKEVIAFREKLILLAVGESGRRTYGSHKWILPDERNICAIKQMPLHRKLVLKGLLTTGTHIGEPEAILWNAKKVELSAKHPILAQMDGEAVLLEKNDFPAVIELTEPVMPIIKEKDQGLG
jgi:diacylglycerol kinase family enzyme